MSLQVGLLICENFRREVLSILPGSELGEVSAAFFPAQCSAQSAASPTAVRVSENHDGGTLLAGCRACVGEHGSGNCPFGRCLSLDRCAQLLTGNTQLESLSSRGAFPVTAGWLRRWRYWARRHGQEPEILRRYLPASTSCITLVDSGVDPQSAENLREFASYMDYPHDRITVGLDYFRLMLANELNHCRLHIAGRNGDAGTRRDSATAGSPGQSDDSELKNSLQRELSRAREEADAYARARNEFLSNMSHEIRTPMNGILGMLDLLVEQDLAGETRTLAECAQFSAHSLLSVVNEILDFSRIQTGNIALESAPFRLRDCVAGIEALMDIAAREKQVQLLTEIEGQVPDELIGDEPRLRQVLRSLLSNAIKFNRRDGMVVLQVRKEPVIAQHDLVRLQFAISDCGIGIEQEKLEAIFQPFTQADGSSTRQFGGTGLGLTISRGLVELMGGHIQARSQAGTGSLFHFSINLRKARATHAAPDPAARALQPAPGQRALRLLLAEDNVTNQQIMIRMLGKMGHRTTLAGDGVEALNIISSQPPFDAVLMDCQMPLMDGYECAAAIRKMEKNGGRRLRIIAVTAHATQGSREKCLNSGMDDYVSKPVNISELKRALNFGMDQQLLRRSTAA